MGPLAITITVVAVILVIAIICVIIAVKSAKPHENSIWRSRKRNCLGLPWSFTVYDLSDDRFFVTSGFLNLRDEEIRLYRVIDITYKASIWQRLFGMGTITMNTSDKTTNVLEIKNVKKARDVKELIYSTPFCVHKRRKRLKRKIILFLLNLIGGKKNQEERSKEVSGGCPGYRMR